MRSIPIHGLHEPRCCVLNLVRRNVTVASSLICSPRIGGRMATTLKFAILSQRVQNLQVRAARSRPPCYDKVAHYGNHPYGAGILRHRFAAGQGQDSIPFVRFLPPPTAGYIFPITAAMCCNATSLPSQAPGPMSKIASRRANFKKNPPFPNRRSSSTCAKQKSRILCRIYSIAFSMKISTGSGLFAIPLDPRRSICGTETKNLRLEPCANELRATLALSSGEVLRDLPVVDRDWRDFIDAALADNQRSEPRRPPRSLSKLSFSL